MTSRKTFQRGACLTGSRARRSSGIVAIEFAMIFPAFFVLFYGIVTYGLIFAAQQALTLAAAEGARAAVRYPGGATDSIALRTGMACRTARSPLLWLQNMGGLGAAAAECSGSTGPGVHAVSAPCASSGGSAGSTCITVTVQYAYNSNPLVPPLLGSLMSLPTPAMLQARAVAQVHLL